MRPQGLLVEVMVAELDVAKASVDIAAEAFGH